MHMKDTIVSRGSASVVRALGNKQRLQMAMLLKRDGELTGTEMRRELGLSQSSTSQHLGVLRRAALVDWRKEGLHHYYRLKDQRALELLDMVQRWEGMGA